MNSCKKYVYKNKTFFNTRFPFAIRHVDNLKADFNLTKRFCREFWKITYVVSGTGSFVINDRKFPIQPRSLFLVHPSAFTTFDINEEKLNL